MPRKPPNTFYKFPLPTIQFSASMRQWAFTSVSVMAETRRNQSGSPFPPAPAKRRWSSASASMPLAGGRRPRIGRRRAWSGLRAQHVDIRCKAVQAVPCSIWLFWGQGVLMCGWSRVVKKVRVGLFSLSTPHSAAQEFACPNLARHAKRKKRSYPTSSRAAQCRTNRCMICGDCRKHRA